MPSPFPGMDPFIETTEWTDFHVQIIVEFQRLLSPQVSPKYVARTPRAADQGRAFVGKREELLQAGVNLVEIDLLRLGVRPITVEPLATATDYCALVHRANRRGQAEVYEWTIRNSLPGIRVPLANGDPDVLLPLQRALVTVYDFNAYELTLRYPQTSLPHLKPGDVEFISQCIASTPQN